MNKNIKIRMASPSDAVSLLLIYAPYVKSTAVTFEYSVPKNEEFAQRVNSTLTAYPWLTAEYNGETAGYAYAGKFHERAAYSRSAETSIYIKQKFRGFGIGSALYETLEKLLAVQGILNLNACIAYQEKEDEFLNKDSVRFHEKHGFTLVGRFHKCGYKFDRWYDMIWMEKQIGEHTKNPAPFVKITDIGNDLKKQCGIEL